MKAKTNLRVLRHRHGLRLKELETASGLSNQYISQAELGHIQPTSCLERQMESAVEAVIVQREKDLTDLKKDYQIFKGRLLLPTEGTEHEQ